MKSSRQFNCSSSVLSHLRIVTAVTLMSAAAAMVLVAANPSGPSPFAKSDGQSKVGRDTKPVRSRIFAKRLETLLGIGNGGEGPFDGAAQEAYDNRAYPKRWIDATTAGAAANAAVAIANPAANQPAD